MTQQGAVEDPAATTAEPVWLSDDEQRVWRLYLRAHADLMGHLHRRLQAASQLSLPDYEVLADLTERPDGQARIFELSRSLQWEKSRLSHHLKRMEARGLITRQNCPTDARGSIVCVTQTGWSVMERAAPSHVADVRRLVFDALTGEQIADMEQICATTLAMIARDLDDPLPDGGDAPPPPVPSAAIPEARSAD